MNVQPKYKLKIIVTLSVLLTALLLCTTIAVSILLRRSIQNQMLENGGNTLAQLQSSMEIILDVMDDSLVQVALDTDLQTFSDRYELLDIFDCEALYDRLYQFRATNRYIDKLYIYYYQDDRVIDLNGKDARLTGVDSVSDGALLRLAGARCIEERFQKTFTIFNMAGEGERPLLVAAKSASPIAATPHAIIVVTLNQDYFQEIVQAISPEEGCILYVLDENNGLLFGQDRSDFMPPEGTLQPGEKRDGYFSMKSVSEESKWSFVYEISEEKVGAQVRSVTLLLWVITGAMTVTSLIGVWFLSERLYRPVRVLLTEKQTAERLLEENKPFLKEGVLRHLLESNETSQALWQERLKRYDACFLPEGMYAAAILATKRYDRLSEKYSEKELDTLFLYAVETIRSVVEKHGNLAVEFVQGQRNGKLVLLFSVAAGEPEGNNALLHSLLQELFEAVEGCMGETVTIGVGGLQPDLGRMYLSYAQAEAAYQYRAIVGDHRTIFADELPPVCGDRFVYPFQLEREMLNAVKQSERTYLEQTLGAFFAYVRTNMPPAQQLGYLSVQLFNDVTRFLQELSIDDALLFENPNERYAEILRLETLDSVEEYFRRVLFALNDYILSCREGAGTQVHHTILQYLDENYTSEEISLNSLADELHFSVSYLVKAFKTATGKSIKEYVTEKRMEKAQTLLRGHNAKVNEVARKVGYTNARSFINGFKKYAGITPGEYRDRELRGTNGTNHRGAGSAK